MPEQFGRFELQLCDIQGRLFELSMMKNLDSADFIEKFMNSEVCVFFDLPYDRHQWAGEEYVMATLLDEIPVLIGGEMFDKEVLYWTGYVYRYWHLFTGESSREIYIQATANKMKDCYAGFHILDVVMAIENLKELSCYAEEE